MSENASITPNTTSRCAGCHDNIHPCRACDERVTDETGRRPPSGDCGRCGLPWDDKCLCWFYPGGSR